MSDVKCIIPQAVYVYEMKTEYNRGYNDALNGEPHKATSCHYTDGYRAGQNKIQGKEHK